MKKYIQNENGITLLEVVISLLIITIIFISFFGMFVQSKKANNNAGSFACNLSSSNRNGNRL
ncbi:prepilin-type N-terminal cleavage/methylation domain-containing protein [Ureibacillus acetophenoni]